ncbi:MAG: hypothetical protein K8I29_17145, partial [Alphaproteobacteria bacterium]|nr:hypothetical protein [Candidatus Nitrobium versatile]
IIIAEFYLVRGNGIILVDNGNNTVGKEGDEGVLRVEITSPVRKVLTAKKAMSYGIKVNIISGKKKGLLTALLNGEPHGTEFRPRTRSISSRKGWIAYAIRPKGTLLMDEGAVHAVLRAGKSLLPSGILSVKGAFDTGDAVYCTDPHGKRIAKGIVNYSSPDVERIKGKRTSEIEAILGYKYSDEVIHRDNLVLLP